MDLMCEDPDEVAKEPNFIKYMKDLRERLKKAYQVASDSAGKSTKRTLMI